MEHAVVDDAARHRRRWQLALLGLSLLMAAVDYLLTGVAIAFGPSGFGGDRTMPPDEIQLRNVGIAAGMIAIVLGVAAAGAFLLSSGRLRTRLLIGAVGTQAIATLILWVSESS
jgi:hypothetical protein